uniref:Uncharacterized protein n=1 Tax=Arundo donax TaxID=35708 RepID=A0A0A8XVZ4_ARUDO
MGARRAGDWRRAERAVGVCFKKKGGWRKVVGMRRWIR